MERATSQERHARVGAEQYPRHPSGRADGGRCQVLGIPDMSDNPSRCPTNRQTSRVEGLGIDIPVCTILDCSKQVFDFCRVTQFPALYASTAFFDRWQEREVTRITTSLNPIGRTLQFNVMSTRIPFGSADVFTTPCAPAKSPVPPTTCRVVTGGPS